nr:DUF2303 family protein [Neisseria subflava]
MPDGTPVLFTPGENGDWSFDTMPEYRATPDRKKGFATAHDLDSLIAYVKKHQTAGTEIYIDADFLRGNIGICTVLNGDTAKPPVLKISVSTTARYLPRRQRVETLQRRKAEPNPVCLRTHQQRPRHRELQPGRPGSQIPTGSEVLDFAMNLEYTEKTTFKQGYREQDGRMNFVFQSEDAGKTTHPQAFEKFGVAFTPFLGGKTYFVEALLKFRIDKTTVG